MDALCVVCRSLLSPNRIVCLRRGAIVLSESLISKVTTRALSPNCLPNIIHYCGAKFVIDVKVVQLALALRKGRECEAVCLSHPNKDCHILITNTIYDSAYVLTFTCNELS